MAAKALMLPATRIFNSNTAAIPGATASLYTTGTTTPQLFYADADLSVSLGNTIRADGIGQLPNCYQEEDTAFRLILRDALGNTIDGGDIDPFHFGSAMFGTITTASGAAVPSRALLAAIASASAGRSAILTEEGREGSFVFDDSDLSAKVTADTLQGIYVAPSTDTTGASGAWVRKFDGPINVAWFGVLGDGTTDNLSAVTAMLDFADATTHKHYRFGTGTHKVSAPLTIPDNVTIEGAGRSSILQQTNASGADPWVIYQLSGSGFTVRDLKLIPSGSGASTRGGLVLAECQDVLLQNLVIDAVSGTWSGMYLFDCDRVIVDKLYYHGGTGTAVYNSGGQNCKIVNSHATDCFAGFTISSFQTDFDITPVVGARDVADVYGNIISGCTVRNCTSQAYTITGATYNTISNCHAEDYTGVGTHKAFQVKDTTGDSSRGNIIIGCTVKNYPAGFGGQQGSHVKFIGCTTRDNSTNGFELNSMNGASVIGCAAYGFGQAGIWTGSTTVSCHFDNITLETSTTTAIGIKMTGPSDSNNNFDNIITTSTLASFINIAAACNNNRFGRGCRSNGNALIDATGTTEWPVILTSPAVSLTATSKNYLVPYVHRGMYVAAARLIITTTIAGTTSPQIAVGRDGSSGAIASAQTVTGAAPSVVSLTVFASLIANGQLPTWNVTTAAAGGTPAGAGYVQVEGLLAN